MSLVDRIVPKRSPLPGVITGRDYRAARAKGHFEAGESRLFGRPIRHSSAGGFLHSVHEIFGDEVYRFDAAIPAPHIIDAGANIGLSILYFKRRFPDATIVAYEPDAAIFELLRGNVGHLPGVELRRAAAWVEDTTLSFWSEGSLAGSVELDSENRNQVVNVPAERLRTELAKRPVDFLKIDIEGAENSVLFDIADALDGVGLLFFEYHSNPDKPQLLGELLNLVTRAGFRYSINGTHGPVHPFVEAINHGFDLQANVFCFRPGADGRPQPASASR